MNQLQLIVKRVILLATGVSTFAYAMFQGGFVSWFLFYSTALIILTTLIYAIMPIGRVEVMRKLSSERLIAGEDLSVTITVTRKSRFPFLYLIVEDIFPEAWNLKNKPINSKVILYPSFQKRFVYSYTVNQPKRGEYIFSKVTIRTSDLFGIFQKEKKLEVNDQVVVYPNFQKLDRWNMYNENKDEAYITSQKVIEDITSVAGSREYVPGDRLTSIDWKVTARINKLMTKEFEEYLGQRFLVALDCSIKDKNEALLFEKAVELATSLIIHSHSSHFHIGLLTIADKVKRYPIHYGEAHQGSLLEHLAKLEFNLGNVFDFVFVNEINKITAETIVVVITTRVTDAMIENVRRLKKKRIQTAFCFVTEKVLTKNEQNRLTMLTQLHVPYYVISGNNFQEELKGGDTIVQKS